MHLQALTRDGCQIAGYCCEVCGMMHIINRGVLYVSLHGRVANPDSLSIQQHVYSWYPREGTHMPCGYLLARVDLQQQLILSLHWQHQHITIAMAVTCVWQKKKKKISQRKKGIRAAASASQPPLVSCSDG